MIINCYYGSHQNIGLHTGTHANVVLLTYEEPKEICDPMTLQGFESDCVHFHTSRFVRGPT